MALYTPPTARLYVGLDTSIQNAVDGTSRGDFDVDEAIVPIYVPPGQSLHIKWFGTFLNDRCIARVEYTEA